MIGDDVIGDDVLCLVVCMLEDMCVGITITIIRTGSVFAFSNAAMMAVQLGDEAGALREMQVWLMVYNPMASIDIAIMSQPTPTQGIARRAPGSVDVRAALAAIYWSQGQTAAAEAEWQFACDNITAGCSKYQDDDWLSRIRRWPPVMVGKMADFLAFRVPENVGGEGRSGRKPSLVEGL